MPLTPDEPMLKQLNNMYMASLRAMNAELQGLIEFAYEFKSEEAHKRLEAAQQLIREEITNAA